MSSTAAEKVKRGAALLDQKEPGWFNRVDIESLDMENVGQCIIGQVYGVDNYPQYIRVLKRLIQPQTPNMERLYGFEDLRSKCKKLKEYWVKEIETRKREQHRKNTNCTSVRTLQVRIKESAEQLDKLVPGWFKMVDTKRLCMVSVPDCVLGQIMGFCGVSWRSESIQWGKPNYVTRGFQVGCWGYQPIERNPKRESVSQIAKRLWTFHIDKRRANPAKYFKSPYLLGD